jgi:hypothetical protein
MAIDFEKVGLVGEVSNLIEGRFFTMLGRDTSMTEGEGWEVNETPDDPVRYYPTFEGRILWQLGNSAEWISFDTKEECETFIKEYDNG